MSGAQGHLLTDIRAGLARRIGELQGLKTFEAAFVSWILPSDDNRLLPVTVAQDAIGRSGAERNYRDVAIQGFASAYREFDGKAVAVSGLEWLLGREGNVGGGVPMGFMVDGPALIGIALLGARFPANDLKRKIGCWMDKFLMKSLAAPGLPGWQKSLLAGAASVMGCAVPPEAVINGSADVRVALHARGFVPIVPEELEILEESALRLISKIDPATQSHELCAIQLAVLDWVCRASPSLRPGKPTPEQVVELLRNVSSALRRWTWEDRPRTGHGLARKWYVDNEYHVQNFLWAILAPIFRDLIDEGNLQEVGPVHPRVDLGIPSLKLIIEVKFVRREDSLQKTLREIAEDASLYLRDTSRFSQIIAFVWDDARRTEQHPIIMQGLRKLPGIVDAVIVSRPGGWLEKTNESKKARGNRLT